jgi:hypothetical protein
MTHRMMVPPGSRPRAAIALTWSAGVLARPVAAWSAIAPIVTYITPRTAYPRRVRASIRGLYAAFLAARSPSFFMLSAVEGLFVLEVAIRSPSLPVFMRKIQLA